MELQNKRHHITRLNVEVFGLVAGFNGSSNVTMYVLVNPVLLEVQNTLDIVAFHFSWAFFPPLNWQNTYLNTDALIHRSSI